VYPNLQVFKGGLDIVAVNKRNELIFPVYYSLGVLYVRGKEVKGISDVTSILIDEEGIIWVSTGRMGLFKIRSNRIKNYIYPDGTLNSYSIAELNNRIIASSEYGITELDSSKNQLNRILKPSELGLPNATLGFTFVTKAGRWLISPIRSGLWEFNETLNRWFPLNSYNDIAGEYTVRGIIETDWGSIIFGVDALIYTKDWTEFSMIIHKNDLDQDQIRSIAQLDRNRIIIGTRKSGLWLLDSKLEIKKLLTKQEQITQIRYIEVASEDTLYLAGWNRGIRRVLLDSLQNITEVRSFTTKNGLPNNDTHTLKIDKYGYIWVSSNGGLGRMKREVIDLFFDHGIRPKFQWFGQNDGIANQEFNGGTNNTVFQDSKERLWFANQDGLILIDNNELDHTIPSNPYKLTIDRVYIENRYQNTARIDTLSLELGERRVAFFYGLPDYTNRIVNYEYRLDGLDEDWIYNSSRKAAIYSELNPGTHTFEVRSISSDDSTPATATMTVVVPHYLYEKSWFQLLLGGVLLSVLLFIFIYQSKRLVEWRRLNKQEQKANEEKQKLFDGIAHELRTPLSLVIHPLERILLSYEGKKDTNEVTTKKEIETSLKNAERLNFLVDQISDIRQISLNNKLPVKIEPLALTTYFYDLLNDYVDMGNSLDVVIEYNIPRSTEVYFVDKKGIDRIFNNLMMNAIRYNKKNGTVRVQVIEKGGQCHLVISNQGKGITSKDLPHIFDYLYQGDNASNSRGSGIGLFLVKYWADELGAEIKVDSETDEWTTFTVSFKSDENISENILLGSVGFDRLPLGSRANQDLENPLVKGPKGSQVVLLVDDEIDVLESLSSSFKEYFTIWRANNALNALEIVNREQIDLIITDIKMPTMSGPELVLKIRGAEKNTHIPVIYYSALTSRDISRDGLNTGADIFVSKTASLLELKTIVEDTVVREKRILKIENKVNATESTNDLVLEVEQIVLRHLSDKDLKVDWIADQLFMSRANLYRKWKEVSDISLNDYIKNIRIEEAKHIILSDPAISSSMLANLVGYSSPAYFVKQFEKEVGVKPNEYKIKNP
jgi:signal transduction histidine kinase/AraC-like DNA-binding protein